MTSELWSPWNAQESWFRGEDLSLCVESFLIFICFPPNPIRVESVSESVKVEGALQSHSSSRRVALQSDSVCATRLLSALAPLPVYCLWTEMKRGSEARPRRDAVRGDLPNTHNHREPLKQTNAPLWSLVYLKKWKFSCLFPHVVISLSACRVRSVSLLVVYNLSCIFVSFSLLVSPSAVPPHPSCFFPSIPL